MNYLTALSQWFMTHVLIEVDGNNINTTRAWETKD